MAKAGKSGFLVSLVLLVVVLPGLIRAEPTIPLTSAEKVWLKTHKSVRVMIGAWPPFQYVEDGQPKGLAIDYVTKILKNLGLEVVPVAILWTDALAGINRFEKVDLLPTIARSPEREKMVRITRDYLSFPSVIVTQTGADFVGSLLDLYSKNVAVEKDFITHKRLDRDHTLINVLPMKTTKEALTAVSSGEADAYVGNLAVVTFLIDKLGLDNLKIASQTEYANNNQAVGIRRDWPELASMIDKALAAMTDEERRQIRQKALATRLDHGIDLKEILIWGAGIGGVVIFIFILVIGWSRGLGREIAERKKTEVELAKKEAQLRNALEGMSGGLMMADKDLIIRVINDKIINWYDMPKDVAKPGGALHDLIQIRAERGDFGPGDPDELTKKRLGDYKDNTVKRSEDCMPDGRILELVLSPTDDGGSVIVCNDITERKKAEEELTEKETQVATAIANMPSGIFMIDKNFNIEVVNEKIIEWYDLPEGVGRPGTPLRDFLSVRAYRGDYGTGDPEELIEQRLDGYKNRSIKQTEDHVPGNRILEVLRAPAEDGGMVIICSDITERKRANEELRDNMDKLEKFNSLAVGRELRMIDLKQEINDLLKALGKDPEYEIVE